MANEQREKTDVANKPVDTAPESGGAPVGVAAGSSPRTFRKNVRKHSRDARPRSEYDQKIIDIRRVTRVVAGGRRFSFSVALVAGNRKGMVGVGIGKAGDTALAIDKALKSAKKSMIKIPLTKSSSIPHETAAKYSSARVMISPAPGRGLTAGSSVRQVLELGGVKDVVAKIQSGSKNRLNIARVAIKALSELRSPRETAKKS